MTTATATTNSNKEYLKQEEISESSSQEEELNTNSPKTPPTKKSSKSTLAKSGTNETGNQFSNLLGNPFIDSLYSPSHISPGTEELLLPLMPPTLPFMLYDYNAAVTDDQLSQFMIPTALANNQFLNQNQLLSNFQFNSLMNAASIMSQNNVTIDPSLMDTSGHQMQQSQQSGPVSIPPFHPSNFQSVPVNRQLQTLQTNPDPPKRSRPTSSSTRVISSFAPPGVELYEVTYSQIDVYELVVPSGEQVMRRRDDGWVNATHILKVAGVEKGRRTKIIGREVIVSKYEKIQGGYGRYQGTWVPVDDAKQIAVQFGVLDQVACILNIPV